MKLNEIEEYYKNLSDEQLHEALDKDNSTGFLTEDLVKIVRASQSEEGWSEPMTGEQFIAEMRSWVKKDGQG